MSRAIVRVVNDIQLGDLWKKFDDARAKLRGHNTPSLTIHAADPTSGHIKFQARPKGEGAMITHVDHQGNEHTTLVPDEAMSQLFRWLEKV